MSHRISLKNNGFDCKGDKIYTSGAAVLLKRPLPS